MIQLILFHVCDFPLLKVTSLTRQEIFYFNEELGLFGYICMPDLWGSNSVSKSI